MKRLAKRAVLLASFAAASASAQAQMSYPAEAWWDNRWYVAPYVQFTFSDTARLAKDGTGFGLAVGKAFAPSWDLELRGAYEELPKQGAPDNWHNWTAEVDGKWYFLGREGVARWDGLQPYGIAGLGLIYDSVGTSKTSFWPTSGSASRCRWRAGDASSSTAATVGMATAARSSARIPSVTLY